MTAGRSPTGWRSQSPHRTSRPLPEYTRGVGRRMVPDGLPHWEMECIEGRVRPGRHGKPSLSPSQAGPRGNARARIEGSHRLCTGRAYALPRQHTRYNRRAYVFPEDFPQRLKRFQEESGLSWSEIARQQPALEAAGGSGRQPGPRPPVHRLRRRAGESPRPQVAETQKGPHIGAALFCSGLAVSSREVVGT